MQEISVNMETRKRWAFAGIGLTALLVLVHSVHAQPGVFTTAEGQLGATPGMDDQVIGTSFESIRGAPGDVIFGGISVFGGVMPPPPEMQFLTDKLHDDPDPVPIGSTPSPFANVFKSVPASARSRNAADDGDFVAFSFAVDGSMPQTMSVRVATFDDSGTSFVSVPLAELQSFPGLNNDTGVAVDDQGRITVVYTDLIPPFNIEVKAQRLDAVTGIPIGGAITMNAGAENDADIALLDPSGDRLIIATSDFVTGHVSGRILDTTGPTPVVLPEFQVSTTAANYGNGYPAVAADPSTGAFVVVWENFDGAPGDPVNVRGRRFDADGNPIGNDFAVNTTTANSQGKPDVAYGPNSEWVTTWFGDGTGVEDLDVFARAYDAMGNPIGGEIRVNTETDDVQDRPSVRFLPEPDALGQPQFVVAWRDVGDTAGNMPRGTGTSYKRFSIGEDPALIFADGFESGDTSSW